MCVFKSVNYGLKIHMQVKKSKLDFWLPSDFLKLMQKMFLATNESMGWIFFFFAPAWFISYNTKIKLLSGQFFT